MIKGLGPKPPSPGNYAYEEFSNDFTTEDAYQMFINIVCYKNCADQIFCAK